jgi:transglutaminase-like superfamily./putative cell wall binding repeat
MNVAKKWGMAMLALGLSIFMALPAFAGEWIYDGPENWNWWYKEADGTYPKDSWKQIDGEWYHFDNTGYLDIGWHNYPIYETFGEGEESWKEKTNCWYYMDDSGKMLKNQNYIGGYSDDSGLLFPDWLDQASLKYRRYIYSSTKEVMPPVADAKFIDSNSQSADSNEEDSEGYGIFKAWEYDITDYRKEFFTEMKKHIQDRDISFKVPLTEENRSKDLAFLINGVNDILDNLDIAAKYQFTIKDGAASFNFEYS